MSRWSLPIALAVLAGCAGAPAPPLATPAPTASPGPGAVASPVPGPGGPAGPAPVVPAVPGPVETPMPGPTATPVPAPSAPAAPTSAPTGPWQPFDLAPGAAEVRALPAAPALTAVVVRAGEGDGPARVAATAAPAAPAARRLLATRALGETETFWVNTGDFTAAGDRERTCRRAGERAGVVLYVDGEARATAAQLADLLDAFADAARPRVEAVFGRADGPFVGDGPIVLVVSPAVGDFGARSGELGYFWPRDLMPGEPHSNGVPALFLSDDLVPRPAVVRRGVIAHEFAHLAAFARKSAAAGRVIDEAAWLDEGYGMLAQDVAGAGMADGNPHPALDVASFQADPGAIGLFEWRDAPGVAYGRSYLFARYVYDRLGAGAIAAMLASPTTGRQTVEAALVGTGIGFEAFVRDWALALYFAGDGAAAGQAWRWRGPALRGEVAGVTLKGFTPRGFEETSAMVVPRPWGILAMRAPGPGPWRVELAAPPGDRLVGALVAPPR